MKVNWHSLILKKKARCNIPECLNHELSFENLILKGEFKLLWSDENLHINPQATNIIYVYRAPILDVSRSHTTTQPSRQDSSGRVISSSQRPLPDNTRHSQQTNIHACGRSPVEIVGSNPTGAWIFVCCECRVLSSRGLCDELIARPEESYRLWCVVVCDLETSRMGAPYIYIYIYIYIYDISSLRVNLNHNCIVRVIHVEHKRINVLLTGGHTSLYRTYFLCYILVACDY